MIDESLVPEKYVWVARKLRIQFPGALYHVINRGNYRSDIFATEGAKGAFLECLDEACGKTGWRIHAWCLMSNHYHLAVETPEPNLSEGMRWLQATFAARYNRFRQVRGHLFQGRFKAIAVEDGDPLANVCHYIHLNPVRAGIVEGDGLKDYAWTSLRWLMNPRSRPVWYTPMAALEGAGNLRDDTRGRRKYVEYLNWMSQDASVQKEAQFEKMCKGWAFGSRDFKQALLKDHDLLKAALELDDRDAIEAKEMAWEAMCLQCMNALGKSEQDVGRDRKSARWKVAIAVYMKERAMVRNGWLADRLGMGSAGAVSTYVHFAVRNPPEEVKVLKELMP